MQIPLSLIKHWKLIVFLILLVGIWFHGFQTGISYSDTKIAEKTQTLQKSLEFMGNQYTSAKAKLDSKTEVKLRTVYVEKDDSGCADSIATSGVLDALRPDEARPPTNF